MENTTTHADVDAAALKSGLNPAVPATQENGANHNGSTNGNGVQENGSTTTSGASSQEPVAGPSSGETKSMETVNLAMQHLAAGKRDLLISDPNAAVASLALACELLGTHYGEMAFECGESYYYYGRALLELARLEAGVIENLDGDAGLFLFLYIVHNLENYIAIEPEVSSC